ncbi:hypothetical protein L7F22_069243 [Adiantum nelumboides]|nr:hypothetical protein [Adiantum nelumboides]
MEMAKTNLSHKVKQDEDLCGEHSIEEVPTVTSSRDDDDTLSSSSNVLDNDGTWETWSTSSRYDVYESLYVNKAKANMHEVKAKPFEIKGMDDGSCPENGNSKTDKVWETFQKSFSQVQAILDQNRVLIREINQNHESKIPENLTRNVALIRELNRNIARVVELYANLSTEFVQSMSETALEEDTVNNLMKMDTDGSNSFPFPGQKKPRHG